MPPPLSSENKKRLKQIIRMIKHHNPDIIALQEVWLHKYVDQIKEHFKDYFIITTRKKFFNNAGLVTLSKIKPLSAKIKYFDITKKHNFLEKLGRKGYHMLEIPVAKKIYTFVNTHLYCPRSDKEMEITSRQFCEIKNATKEQEAILTGDLNIEEDKFVDLNANHFYYKPIGEITICNNNKYHQKMINKHLKADMKADYSLIKSKAKRMISDVVRTPVISDHFAVLTIFDI